MCIITTSKPVWYNWEKKIP